MISTPPNSIQYNKYNQYNLSDPRTGFQLQNSGMMSKKLLPRTYAVVSHPSELLKIRINIIFPAQEQVFSSRTEQEGTEQELNRPGSRVLDSTPKGEVFWTAPLGSEAGSLLFCGKDCMDEIMKSFNLTERHTYLTSYREYFFAYTPENLFMDGKIVLIQIIKSSEGCDISIKLNYVPTISSKKFYQRTLKISARQFIKIPETAPKVSRCSYF